MRPNARTLALRDPALASLMGAIAGDDYGADFGDEYGLSDYGDDYGDEYGDDYSYEFGDDYGYTPSFGAAAPLARHAAVKVARPVAPPAAVAAKLWHKHRRSVAKTERRVNMLEPNRGSNVKVERYSFSVNAALVLGAPSAITASGQPDTNIRPQRCTMNAPAPGFIIVSEIKVANVSVTVGGLGDAFEYNPLGVGMSLDMPTLSPANRATVLGNYSGFTPPGFTPGAAFTFVASFKGPSSIVA